MNPSKMDFQRYMLTGFLDDIRECSLPQALQGAVNCLYDAVSDYFFRFNRTWGGKGKYRIAKLKAVDPVFGEEYYKAFQAFYRKGSTGLIIALVEDLLNRSGGPLYDLYQPAKAENRKPLE